MAAVGTNRELDWSSEAMTSPETTRAAQMNKVFGYLKGLHAAHLMDIGTRLELFGRLARSNAMTPGALAAALRLDPDYVRLWCEAACALELLDYNPEVGYQLAPFMDEILGRPDATYYLGRFPQVHLLVARDYARYPELFHTGGTFPYQEHDQAFLSAVAEGLQTLPRQFLDAVLPKLPRLQSLLAAGANILDVGCGGGFALVEFAERFPNVRSTGIDLEPLSIEMANELIRSRGLAGRVQAHLVGGDSLPPHFAGVFDLVTMFLVLHEIRPDLKPAVLKQCAEALRPGGQLVIFDERYASGPAELREPFVIFAVMAQWYEMTWGNRINTRAEIHDLLAQAGLRIVDETSLSRFYIVTAEKRR
jgi:SAM-dependent methyltransferase